MFSLKFYARIETLHNEDDGLPRPNADFDIDGLGIPGPAARAKAWALGPLARAFFAVARTICPNLRLGRLVLVTRAEDVVQVLNDSDAFRVPFGPEMTDLAANTHCMLGMDGRGHTHIRDATYAVLQRSDVQRLCARSEYFAARLLAASGGSINVVQDLIRRATTEVCAEYLGLQVDDPEGFGDWLIAMSALLFADPTGNAATRRLALAGAERVRAVMDAAIARARRHPDAADSIVHRLVRLPPDQGFDDGTIRATLMVVATGFIPTLTLAATNMLAEMLRRPAVMQDAIRAAQNADFNALQKIMMEAGRLNPALTYGQWRTVAKPATIAPGTWRARQVRAGDVLLVGTSSALRDGRMFAQPGTFDPERPVPNIPEGMVLAAQLMFGGGPHQCLGLHIAPAMATAILGVLLSQPNLRRAPGKAGRVANVGPFPHSLTMEFDTERPISQTMVVLCAPLTPKADLTALLDARLGNPAQPKVAASLACTGIVHFASLSVVDVARKGIQIPHVLLELNVDGPQDAALHVIAGACGDWLGPVFGLPTDAPVSRLTQALLDAALDLDTVPWGTTGLNFNGTGEFPVADIERQHELAEFTADALALFQHRHAGMGGRATQALSFIRGLIRPPVGALPLPAGTPAAALAERGAEFADFLVRPSGRVLSIATWTDTRSTQKLVGFLRSYSFLRWVGGALLLWLAFAATIGISLQLAQGPWHSGGFATPLLLGASSGLVLAGLVIAGLAGGFVLLLRYHETHDVPDDRAAPLAHIRAIAASENHPGFVQNHITAVTPMKPGWFRRLTLAVALFGIKSLVTYFYRPGFVLDMGTIHYAKWFRPAGSDTLIFLANYDGSWDSYLEDFIIKAHPGQTAAWSNGQGFPPTRFLIKDGAQDGERFKRWVRRQQKVTQFWYNRFPDLTTDRIRTNALIHDGLMHATTDSAARAWLDCFGSMTRPVNTLETEEVQSIVFRALGDLPYAAIGLLRLPSDSLRYVAWLRDLVSETANSLGPVSFGDRASVIGEGSDDTAVFVAFTAAGLATMGLPNCEGMGLDTFPPAFRLGMANRAHVLRDAEDNDRPWFWADAERTDAGNRAGCRAVHVVVMVFAKTKDRCAATLNAHEVALGPNSLVHRIETAPVTGLGPGFEHFGFRDGLSQPVIRGTRRSRKVAPERDIQAPGEFILGYRNNQNYFPLTPTVPPSFDPNNNLAAEPAMLPGRFPFFAPPAGSDQRDFGRNGTFIVLRELDQHVERFTEFTARAAHDLGEYRHLADALGNQVTADWVAAKLVGRWRDGTPLVDRRPLAHHHVAGHQAPADPTRRPDNDFEFGTDDPQGMQCPFAAHIRRANPRESLSPGDPEQQIITNRHRLLRRGRSYERPAKVASEQSQKGLIFVAVCADIERQFEFLQQTWIGSPNFHGLANEPDPLLGPVGVGANQTFTVPTQAGAIALKGISSFVTLRGGGYFFLPSRSALQFLLGLNDKPQSAGGMEGPTH